MVPIGHKMYVVIYHHQILFNKVLYTKSRNCFMYNSCMYCVYYYLGKAVFLFQVRVATGLYEPYLRDWLAVFSRQNFHIVLLKEYQHDRARTMAKVFKYLQLGKCWLNIPGKLESWCRCAQALRSVNFNF